METEIKNFYDDCLENNPGRLEYLANYLTDLFFELKKQYNAELGCPQIKIHKMLLILQACYVIEYGKETKIKGLNNIIVYKCGFKLPDMLIPYNITSSNQYTNLPIGLNAEQYKYLQSIDLSNKFFNDDQFSSFTQEQRIIVLKLFDYFGDFNPYELGKILDTIKPLNNELATITLDKFQDWVLEAYKNDTLSNRFIDFIHYVKD